MDRTIIHVDMDAFYAAVEVRDNPELAGLPLIVGALPDERGVVATCSYEARSFGVRSGMSIKDAYRRCPQGVYMHPDIKKYAAVSDELHKIWGKYTDIVQYVSLDEGYLDISLSGKAFGGAKSIAREIKCRTLSEAGLTCSVGIGYSMMSAKLASEEKKPNGFFEIPDAKYLLELIGGRDVGIVYGIGKKTAEQLHNSGIHTVRDIIENESTVIRMFGKHGGQIAQLARGIDIREVTPYYDSAAKSLGREHTFQQDIADFDYLKSVLRLIAKELSTKIRLDGLYVKTITLKITYGNMKQITRSKSGNATNQASTIYSTAAALLDSIDKKPIRLVGISLSGFTESDSRQLSLEDMAKAESEKKKTALDSRLLDLQRKYGAGIIKTGSELEAEKRLSSAPTASNEKKEPI